MVVRLPRGRYYIFLLDTQRRRTDSTVSSGIVLMASLHGTARWPSKTRTDQARELCASWFFKTDRPAAGRLFI